MADWEEPFTAHYRFMRVSRQTGLETEELSMFEQGGSITRNSDTSTKESGKANITGDFDIGSDLVRIYLDATGMYTGWQESAVLGTFLPSVSSRDVDGPMSSSSVDLDGRLKELDDDDFDGPITIEAGSKPVEEAKKIAEGCGLTVIADDSDYTLSTTWTFGAESDEKGKLDAVNALLDIAGFASADTDEMGNVLMRRYVDPTERPVAHRFVEGPNARFLAQMDDELDTSDVKNVMKAIYSTQDVTVIGIAEDDDPNSRWSTVTLGRRIVGTERYNDEATQEQANAKAKELLANSQSVIHRVTFEHTYIPNVRITDAVSIDFSTGGVSGDFVTRTQKITLGAGCMFKDEVKRSER